MVEINLLPEEFTAAHPINRFASALRRLAIVGFSLLIFLLIASGLYLFFLNIQIKNSLASQEELKTQIKSLEQTEQQFVLVRDRVVKAKLIINKPSLSSDLDDFQTLVAAFPSTIFLTEVNMISDKTEATFLAGSSLDLVQLMASLLSLDLYKRVELTSFGFTPATGYLLTLELIE